MRRTVYFLTDSVPFYVSDMAEERNMLLKEVYPKITEYAKKKYGVNFQVRYRYLLMYSGWKRGLQEGKKYTVR